MKVLLIHDQDEAPPDVLEYLGRHHEIRVLHLEEGVTVESDDVLLCAVDVGFGAAAHVRNLRSMLTQVGGRTPRVFVTDALARRHLMPAFTLGAHEFLVRPLDVAQVQTVLQNLVSRRVEQAWDDLDPIEQSALKMSLKVHEGLMEAARLEQPIAAASVAECGEAIVRALAHVDLQAWLRALRDHHNYTFRHVMFVTGTLVSFANMLGIKGRDMQNVVAAGILHDIGKSSIPLEILDKPTKLDEDEWLRMRQHPAIGAAVLAQSSDWPPEVVDAVLHHHERLDGGGYPSHLRGAMVRDLTRLVSIADVFSALIDKRAYKEKMSGRDALTIMRTLDGQLDMALVDAFEPVALTVS